MTQTGSKSRTAVELGGVTATREELVAAIDVLTAAKGIMVKQPLARASNPLAAADYHSIAAAERANEGSESLSTKAAFLAALQRLAS